MENLANDRHFYALSSHNGESSVTLRPPDVELYSLEKGRPLARFSILCLVENIAFRGNYVSTRYQSKTTSLKLETI